MPKIYLDNCCYKCDNLIKRESFNYTEWQRTLWDDMDVDAVFKLAAEREHGRSASDGSA